MRQPWEKQEADVAKRRGGKRNAGSGSGWRRRNDVTEPAVLWEMKSTGDKQITLKRSDLQVLRQRATLAGVVPAMHIQIGDPGCRWVLITENDFDERFPTTG